MKRLLLAGLLVPTFALSRTGARAEQDDAYGSLIGMADAAAGDKGPQAGDVPPAGPSAGERPSAEAPSGPAPRSEYGSARIIKPEKRAPAPGDKREAAKADDAPSVSVLAAAAPRVWTRLFASLLPPMTRVSSFEVAASTAARGPRPGPARPATPASVAGSAQGILELVAAATAPYGAEVPPPDAAAGRPTAPYGAQAPPPNPLKN